MLGQKITSGIATFVAGLMLFAAPIMVQAADVSDAAGFFSAKAVEDANLAIRDLVKKTGHDIRIETHATVPTDKVEQVAKMDRKDREAFMHKWKLERAQAVKETGTLILICKDPARIETWFSGKLKDAGMTQVERDQITNSMIAGFKEKNFDGALKQTVEKFGQVYPKLTHAKSNLSPQGSAHHVPAPANHGPVNAVPVAHSNWSSIMLLLGAILFGIFVISMISRLFNRGPSGYNGGPQGYQNPGMGGPGYGAPGYGPGPGYGGAGGGGGGFMRNIAGGIFGAVAGNWLYDSISGHSAHAHDNSWNNSNVGGGNQTIGNESDNSRWTDDDSSGGGGWFDGGSSGGGGDFGGSSGGGDFGGGGGDFGGGDSGGGDF